MNVNVPQSLDGALRALAQQLGTRRTRLVIALLQDGVEQGIRRIRKLTSST